MDFDRVAKARAYRAMPSLRQLVLVHQDGVRVGSWVREGDGWPARTAVLVDRAGSLALPSLFTALRLADIYERVVPSPLLD